MKFLVVDDSLFSREVLKSVLKEYGEVIEAEDGVEALRILRNYPEKEFPDIVFLDVTMPGKTGIDILKEIRKVSNVPIIICSAISKAELVAEALKLGATGYIVKSGFKTDAIKTNVLNTLKKLFPNLVQ